jgi:Protein of unknown function (DUF3168)
MTPSTLALQQAIFAALTGNASLTRLLGGPAIYDDVPQPVVFPYVTFGQSTLRDASTSTDPGDEHMITLHIWSRAHGRAEVQKIIDAMRQTLQDAPLALTDHHLINLRYEYSDARRDPDGETIHGTLRLRAVTQPM